MADSLKMLTKKQLRSKILNRLKNQKEEERHRKSRAIKVKLFKLVTFKKAKRIMFYLSDKREVATDEMINEAQKKGKIVAVPVCDINRRKIIPCKVGVKERFKKGAYGIKEPCLKRPLAVDDIDLVIVPGVAFDLKGHRLGRGKGYYDSFLRCLNRRTTSIGLAFKEQILPMLPTTSLDMAVDKILFA